MASIWFMNDDGEEFLIRDLLPNDYDCELNVLFRDDYIATKLWSAEDIEVRLLDKGYEGTPSEIDAVIRNPIIDGLGDCTDDDWSIIDCAIFDAFCEGAIQRSNK